MTLIEGVGQEVIYSFGIGAVLLISICVFFLKRSSRIPTGPSDDYGDRPHVYNPGNCPICMNAQTFGIETNCGHLHCGECFMAYHTRHFNGNPLLCPICRQRIGLLFIGFSQEERTAEQNLPTVERITLFVRRYNRTMTNDLTIWERLREIPILLRYFIIRLIEGEDFLTRWMRFRICFMIAFVILYILVPYDIIPEFVYGIFGYVEDAFIVIAFLFYFAILYRNMIADVE